MGWCRTFFAILILLASQPAAGAPLPSVTLELLADGLNAPIFLVETPDGSGRRIVGEQMGLAYVMDRNRKLVEPPFLDLREKIVPLL